MSTPTEELNVDLWLYAPAPGTELASDARGGGGGERWIDRHWLIATRKYLFPGSY